MQFGKYREKRFVLTLREPNPYMSASYVSMFVWSDPEDDGKCSKTSLVSRSPCLSIPEDTTANPR
jgi:hypothetical protein